MNRLGVLVLTVSAVSIQVNKLPTLTTFASPVPIQSPCRQVPYHQGMHSGKGEHYCQEGRGVNSISM